MAIAWSRIDPFRRERGRFATTLEAYWAFDHAVGSIDELHRLGDGPANAFGGIWLPVLLHPVVVLVALALAPRLIRLGPVLGVIASVVLATYFSTTFEAPAYLGG